MQLALFLLGLLASTAIIGTIIPQNADPMFYTERYGLARARFFELLDLGDMYNSWWFLGLLALFCLNLLMCSAKRLPQMTIRPTSIQLRPAANFLLFCS